MPAGNRKLIPFAILMLSFARSAAADDMVITGSDGYQPPSYVLPVPPALKIVRGQNASGLDIVSAPDVGGEYMQRWLLSGIVPDQNFTFAYVNSGGHFYLASSMTVSGHYNNCYSDVNCRIQVPYVPYMIGAWSDLGPDGIGIVSRANSEGGAPFGALDRDGNVTTRIEEKGTISLKPQTSDAEALPGYGRIFAKDLGDDTYGLFWRDPTGAVRRIDNCPQ
jgi:hypothetical protein